MNYPPGFPFTDMMCMNHGIYAGLKDGTTPCPRCHAEEARLEVVVERVLRRILASDGNSADDKGNER